MEEAMERKSERKLIRRGNELRLRTGKRACVPVPAWGWLKNRPILGSDCQGLIEHPSRFDSSPRHTCSLSGRRFRRPGL